MGERVKGKNSKSSKMIERYCNALGISYTEKTYQNIKLVLECFSEIRSGRNLIDLSIIKRRPVAELIPMLYEAFLKEQLVEYALIMEILSQLQNHEGLDQVVNNIIDSLDKNYGDVGRIHKISIEELYLNNPFPNTKDILEKTGLTRSAYAYRKKEAIMLVGCVFWQECLKTWTPTKDALEQAEKSAGREYRTSKIINEEVS